MLIRETTTKDMVTVAKTMADSFEHDPLYSYFIKDYEQRKRFLREFMRFRLLFGMKKGITHIYDDASGVAVWIPPHIKMRPIYLALYGGLIALLKCKRVERERLMSYVRYVDKVIDRNVKGDYWHLAPLCVSPDKQGKGLGSALLAKGLATKGIRELPCLVATQTLSNKAFYESNGFVTVDQTFVPGTDVHNILLLHNS